jgi:hypothetical protein
MLKRLLLSVGALALCAALIPVAACGGDDDDDDDDDSTTCGCECACCVAIGNCDTPSALTAGSSTECDQGCSDKCGGSYSNSYTCS